MVLCESVSDFPPNLVRIFKRGLDSQQSRILTACWFNTADTSHFSKSEMHAWTFLNCLNFWTDWQWIETTRKSGSCAFKFTSGVSWGLSFPSDHTFTCELRVHHSFKQGPSFSACFYRNHMETVKTLVKNELWCTWKALWIISARSCTFINQSWNLAGCSGLVTHCTQSSGPNPSLTESSRSSSMHSSRLWVNVWVTASLGSLFHAWYRWGY